MKLGPDSTMVEEPSTAPSQEGQVSSEKVVNISGSKEMAASSEKIDSSWATTSPRALKGELSECRIFRSINEEKRVFVYKFNGR